MFTFLIFQLMYQSLLLLKVHEGLQPVRDVWHQEKGDCLTTWQECNVGEMEVTISLCCQERFSVFTLSLLTVPRPKLINFSKLKSG